MTVSLGVDVLIAQAYAPLKGKRVGLYTNLSATDSELIPTYERFVQAPQVNLVALFAPEHGIWGAEADGVHIHSMTDSRTGIMVHSLYGEAFRPTSQMLGEIDVMVCDIQDVGVRYYTFLWSLMEVIDACGAHAIPVLILDRPNPLGGRVWGAPLNPMFSSIVGRYNIPTVHGMTLGEITRYLQHTFQKGVASITVIQCEGWQRHMRFSDTGLSWVCPSPAMASPTTALHYGGSCLLEGTNISEGRGTSLPFEALGAPFIKDPFALATQLNALGSVQDSLRFRPHVFKPTSSKFAGQICYGVQAHILNADSYQPLYTWLEVIRLLRHTYDEFAWLPPYKDILHFDLLIGTDKVRQQIDEAIPVAYITEGWQAYCEAFTRQREPFLLYADEVQ